MALSARVFSHEYSVAGEGHSEASKRDGRVPVAGLLLTICIPVFAVMIGWAAIDQPEMFLQSLMWGVLPL